MRLEEFHTYEVKVKEQYWSWYRVWASSEKDALQLVLKGACESNFEDSEYIENSAIDDGAVVTRRGGTRLAAVLDDGERIWVDDWIGSEFAEGTKLTLEDMTELIHRLTARAGPGVRAEIERMERGVRAIQLSKLVLSSDAVGGILRDILSRKEKK